jgi:sarcosine oxidase subunit alpha
VGLLTEDPSAVLPEGAQLVADPAVAPPVPMLGHVTSSYMSAALGRSIALALVKDGRRRMGEALFAPLADGRVIRAEVVKPVFVEEPGARQARPVAGTSGAVPGAAGVRSPESPFHRVALTADAHVDPAVISVRERPFLGHINLRGDASDAAFVQAVADNLGVALPSTPNTTASTEGVVAYWLGPDEWLLVTEGEREAPLAASLRDALRGQHASVTEIGSGQTVIVLQGTGVRDLLAKECPFDLDAPSFRPGACAQTRLAKAAVLLRPLDGERIELIVRRSFAEYLGTWLVDAASEAGALRPAARHA